jgi:CubicO group peptidase (beta-lactamase class C family)
LADFDAAYPRGDEITVEHLLTHTSGIRNYTAMPEFATINKNDMTVAEMITFFRDEPLDFEPGSAFNYSNSGYFLLGSIIEQVSGISYERYLRERIFTPLGMQNSYYDKPHRLIKNRARGYSGFSERVINASYISMTLPYSAGSLASNVDDLHRWNQALTNNELISAETFSKAKQTYTLTSGATSNYGYGWRVGDYGNQSLVEHGGGINGFVCHGLRAEPSDRLVLLLTNSDSLVSPMNLAFKTMCEFYDTPYERPAAVAGVSYGSLIGRYQIGPVFVSVESDGNDLMLGGLSAVPLRYYPISENEFAQVDNEFNRISFEIEGNDTEMFFNARGAFPLSSKRIQASEESV